MTTQRKKLIEVSMPLEAINKASAREKSIRHGHPSTLHLWWARRPLAACRAVLFGQLVDDPSGWPEEFPTAEDQERERARLHRLIAEMVPWEATNDEVIVNKARFEIARSIARGRGDEPPGPDDAAGILTYLAENAPPVCDPFCGGGSIPLEAQRLGLRAYGSDLNPVAVLVSKATCEIPPKFAGRPPVNPERSALGTWRGADGLAEDIRYYGQWIRNEAEARIGSLYPKVKVTKPMAAERADLKPYVGKELTVIAWLWARTIASPDPMLRGVYVPLASTFVLSSKKGRECIVVPVVNRQKDGYQFTVKGHGIKPDEFARARRGTKVGRGSNFTCVISGSPVSGVHIKAEAVAGRMGVRLMATVVEAKRGRLYLRPEKEAEETTQSASPMWKPMQELPKNPRWFSPPDYGMPRYADLFTDRQLIALTTFSDLVADAREMVKAGAVASGMNHRGLRLADGGTGADAYADALATYLACALDKMADRGSTICSWDSSPKMEALRNTYARQAIQMTWDFAEGNPFSRSSGNWTNNVEWVGKAVQSASGSGERACVIQQDAASGTPLAKGAIFSTDPPYYDNIGYADLSDFFYVWQRRTLRSVWPDLYRRVQVPKEEELVATPYRHGGKNAAERFFLRGMGQALRNMHESGSNEFPVTIYYAFKQSEAAKEGLTSPGWATFLQAVADCGYVIDGTWPVRTELLNRTIAMGANALASSIVLVCRKRSSTAPTVTRRELVAQLRATLPDALTKIRAGGVGPVDIAQATLGPGMGVFTAAARVLEPDDTPMTVRTAIALINQMRDEISGEEATSYDADTRFCIDWFDAFGFDEGDSGDAITMAQAYNIGIVNLQAAGVFTARGGRARLLQRDELEENWDPSKDTRLTGWECAQHLARVLESPDGGIEAAARLYAKMDSERSDSARMLAYRMYDICERKNRPQEAQTWNMLAQEWPALETAAAALHDAGTSGTLELDLAGGG